MKSRKPDWETIDWRKIQLRIWRIQTKIYDCSKKGNKSDVVKFQKLLLSLFEAKLLAVRKVTQDNRGKICGLKFLPGDVIEIDHIMPKKSGGLD